MTLNAAPAVALAGAVTRERAAAAAARRSIVLLVPVIVPVTVSVAVTALAAGRLEGHAVGEGVDAVVAGDEGVVRRQRRPVPSLLVKWTVPV